VVCGSCYTILKNKLDSQVQLTKGNSDVLKWLYSKRGGAAILRLGFKSTTVAGWSDEPTIGVVARMSDTELPYVASFARHYANLGAHNLYLICPDFDVCERAQRYADTRQNLTAGSVDLFSLAASRLDCLAALDPRNVECAEEDYILPVQISEYLVLGQGHGKFADTLKQHLNATSFSFRWSLVPYDGVDDGPPLPYKAYAAGAPKYLVKKSAAKQLTMRQAATAKCDPNSGETCPIIDLGPCLVYFYSRGLGDCALMDAAEDARAAPQPAGSLNLLASVKHGVPTPRMKHLAWSSATALRLGPYLQLEHKLLEIDRTMEDELLSGAGVDMAAVKKTYNHVKKLIGDEGVWEQFIPLADVPSDVEHSIDITSMDELMDIYNESLRKSQQEALDANAEDERSALEEAGAAGKDDDESAHEDYEDYDDENGEK